MRAMAVSTSSLLFSPLLLKIRYLRIWQYRLLAHVPLASTCSSLPCFPFSKLLEPLGNPGRFTNESASAVLDIVVPATQTPVLRRPTLHETLRGIVELSPHILTAEHASA